MVIGRIIDAARNPAQLVVGSFVVLILAGAVLLRLPIAWDPGAPSPRFHHCLFWSTSAATVTGLGSIDIKYFSLFGELVLLTLIQVGGFGIMTIGSVLALLTSRRVGLKQRMLAQAEIGAVDFGELRFLLGAIAKITAAIELTIGVILLLSFHFSGGVPWGRAAYAGIFHSISAFNNAGISLFSDSLMGFNQAFFILIPVTIGFILGGLGFPIFVEVVRGRRGKQGRRSRRLRRGWSLHTRITLTATAFMLVVGPLIVLIFEWSNEATLGPMSIGKKLIAAWFQGATPRTAGFNTIDIGALHEPTQNLITGLMFIGAGPASTAGGIKVTTFAVLGFAMWSEVRGDADINVFRRRLPHQAARQAMTVALLSVGVVFGAAIAVTGLSGFSFTDTLFEATSAFGTVGLSTGITTKLNDAARYVLIVVMLAGRVGPVTLVAALALRARSRTYRYAEEQPIIG